MADTEPFVRDDVRQLLDLLAANPSPPLADVTPDEARAAYLALGMLTEAPARDLAVIRDLACPGPAGDIPLRLYDPRENREPGPLVMFFHGGGFVIGDLESHHAFCTELSHGLDLPVIAVHYRRAPEAPYPAAPDDCEAAARWAAGSPEALGRSVTGLVTCGDSAGGNLSIVVAQALSSTPAAVPVIVQAPIYPDAGPPRGTMSHGAFGEGFFLTARSIDYFDACYAGDLQSSRRYPSLHRDLAASPPTVLTTASLDPIRDPGRDYAAQLIRNGVEVTYLEARGNVHGYINMRKAVPSSQGDVDALIGAIRAAVERHS
ncbi:alpha/beta hydrolase [Tsuneonella sp. YG55]|uniref:Alpha/beta hydrolase n=1 Tax=Tsuneonella litorea TaxID=2976475 RepID=A0A9X3AKS3_9SPHN|nr:alpha/beta hydrolase [Tsuneonella litorea]MCT2558198.1 alpha/beta hydrolase [Tsuneonella litorea]